MLFILSMILLCTCFMNCSDEKSDKQRSLQSGNPLMQSTFSILGKQRSGAGASLQRSKDTELPKLKKAKSFTWNEWQEHQKKQKGESA